MIQSAFQVEKQRLIEIAAEINHNLAKLEKVPRYFGDNLTEQVLDERRQLNIQNLHIASEEPYFGRLDFVEDGKNSAEAIYIGKVGVSKSNSEEIIVIDWRAPVASMFYSYTGGDDLAYYQSPEGIIEGDIHLKRNIVIREQKLQRVVDTYVKGNEDLTGGDEFLIYRLGENKDNKLKDIVSTIQAEQNTIIRLEQNQAIIIQGVAGSGKTTVALHRIAFLLYEYRTQILPERIIIFAPNKMFLDYISNVLPELGVGGIQQTTFLDWAFCILRESFAVIDMSENYGKWFSINRDILPHENDGSGRRKGSLAYRNLLQEVLIEYEENVIPENDFEAWDGVILPAKVIRKWMSEYQHYEMNKRRERVLNRIKKWIGLELDKVFLTHEKKDLKKKANQRLRTYLKHWPEWTPFNFYKNLFQKKVSKISDFLPANIYEETNKNLRKRLVEQEDIPALIFIHNWLYGISKEFRYQHTVIDEAQDFSPFQIALLKDFTIGNSFTILGDLSQAIHSYQGIHSWDEFKDIFGHKLTYFELERSYRSTMEIIEFANKVLLNGGKPIMLAKPVFRSGSEVLVKQVKKDEQAAFLKQKMEELQEKGATTIALIGRTEEECAALYDELQDIGVNLTFIHAKQRDYQGGISILSVYLSKGLEFDAVILFDVDTLHYEKTERDAKLLYVACTRALHELIVCYAGAKSLLI